MSTLPSHYRTVQTFRQVFPQDMDAPLESERLSGQNVIQTEDSAMDPAQASPVCLTLCHLYHLPQLLY